MYQVTWSHERICLEAAELPCEPYADAPDPRFGYVVVRFGQKASAGKVCVGYGLEIRQPLTCWLVVD